MTHNRLSKKIESTLSPLINARLINMGRAHTMEWIIFSPSHSETGNDLSTVEYAIHIQCTWRIRGTKGIIVASDDLYFPTGNILFHDMENFDWSPQGSSRLDERTTLFIRSITNKEIIVLSINADSLGGVTICLSEEYFIDIFPANSLEREYWRFFNRSSSDRHFVVAGDGVQELEDQKPIKNI